MSEPAFYSTGSWQPHAGHEEQFLEAWRDFSRWSATMPGAGGEAVLARDLRDCGRFVSFMPWMSLEAIRAWKAHPEFKQRMGVVQEHVDRFAPTETEVVAHVTAAA
jgi:heme-degrading monooxygenase HmoA